MSKDPPTRREPRQGPVADQRPAPPPPPPLAAPEPAAPEEDEYRPSEWSYEPASHDPEEVSSYYERLLAQSRDIEPSAAEGEPHEQAAMSGANIAPRPNVKNFGRRPDEGPKDTDSKILAISAQLQDLLAQRKLETEAAIGVSPALGKRTGFKPAGAAPTGARLPHAPPISLPIRPLRPPPETGWPGLGRARAEWGKPFLYTVLGLALAAGAFWAGRLSLTTAPDRAALEPSRAPVATLPAEAPAWTAAQIQQLDQALNADRAGDLEGASKILNALSLKAKTIPGLRAYVANVDYRRGNAVDAEGSMGGQPDLSLPFGQGQMAFIYARNRDFDKALDWQSRVIGEDPFSAEGFYTLGEILRRKGQLADAANRLQQALLRLPVEPEFLEQRQLATFKMRLAMIENGRTADLAHELEAQLAVPNPSGYWCLTAAAVALQGGDLGAAAVWLTKARAALGQDRFDSQLADYFFRPFADKAELSTFFAGSASTRQRKTVSRTTVFIDP